MCRGYATENMYGQRVDLEVVYRNSGNVFLVVKWGYMRFIRNVLVVAVSVFLVIAFFRLTEAGVLTPSAVPAAGGTLHSLEEIYAPLASSGYNSSAVVATKQGNALQVTKCIIAKMTGGTSCP